MDNFRLSVGETITIELEPIKADNVPPIGGDLQPLPVPSWLGFDPTVVDVVPAADGLTAAITGLKSGSSTIITNSAQNSNNVNITNSFSVTVLHGVAATSFRYRKL